MSDHDFEILGHQITREVMGDFDASFLVQTASELAQKGIQAKQASDIQAKTTQSDIDAANKAVKADIDAVNACAALEIAQKSSPASVPAKQAAATQATQMQDQAAAGLSPNAAAKRLAAAQSEAKKATDTWSSNPSSVSAAAFAHCWTATVAKAQGAGVSPQALAAAQAALGPAGGPHGGGEPSFYKKMIGPLSVWQWGAVGLGVVAVGFGAMKLFGGKRRK